MCDRHHAGVSRRAVLTGAATAGVAAVAGCSAISGDGGDDAPEPITLTTEHSCDVCGMVIPNHPGPSAQIFYPGNEPAGHANPARFCSTWEAYQFHFERRDEGWEAAAFYVTDYSAVDYRVYTEGGDTLITSHPEADAFVSADSVTYVVDSEVNGAMGRDLIGFSDRADAESFREEYGGQLMEHGDVTRGTIAGLGR
ncbi:MAG: nitrous oxide reductase accessory protein NosL [Haloferacaceae archaeon]